MPNQTTVSQGDTAFGHVGGQNLIVPDYSGELSRIGSVVGGSIAEHRNAVNASNAAAYADADYAKGLSAIHKGIGASKREEAAIVNQLSRRQAEIVGPQDLNTPAGIRHAMDSIVASKEDELMQDLQGRLDRLRKGVIQQKMSPQSEEIRKRVLQSEMLNAHPGFKERINNLFDASMGTTTNELGAQTFFVKPTDAEERRAEKVAETKREVLSRFGLEDQSDNPYVDAVFKRIGQTAQGRAYLENKGINGQLAASEHAEFAVTAAATDMTRISGAVGKMLSDNGVKAGQPIPPGLVDTMVAMVENDSARMQDSVRITGQRSGIPEDEINRTQTSTKAHYDSYIALLKNKDASTLNTRVISGIVEAEKAKIYLNSPAYVSMMAAGFNPSSVLNDYTNMMNNAGNSPTAIADAMENNPLLVSNYNTLSKILNSTPYRAVVAAPTAEEAVAASRSDPDTQRLARTEAQYGFGARQQVPTNAADLHSTKMRAAAAVDTLNDSSKDSGFTFVTLANKSALFQDAFKETPETVQNVANNTLYGGNGLMQRLQQDAPDGVKLTDITLGTGYKVTAVLSQNNHIIGLIDSSGSPVDPVFARSIADDAARGVFSEKNYVPGDKQLSTATLRILGKQIWATEKFSKQMGALPKTRQELYDLIEAKSAPVQSTTPLVTPAPSQAQAPAPEPTASTQGDTTPPDVAAKARALADSGDSVGALQVLKDAGVPVTPHAEYLITAAQKAADKASTAPVPQADLVKLDPGVYMDKSTGNLVHVTADNKVEPI